MYGEAYDGLLIPLLRIASFQRAQQLNDMVDETCKKGLEHTKMCLENEDILESADKKESVVKLLMEFYQMLFHHYAVMKDTVNQMAISNQYCSAIKQYIGETSREHAEALYLKAKALSMDPETPPTQAMSTIKRSIHIWKNIPLSGGPKDLNHAMSLLLKASILARHM